MLPEELIIVLSFLAGFLVCMASDQLLGKIGRRIPSYFSVVIIIGVVLIGFLIFAERKYLLYFLSFILGTALYVPFLMVLAIFLLWKNPAKYKERSMKEARKLRKEAERLKDKHD